MGQYVNFLSLSTPLWEFQYVYLYQSTATVYTVPAFLLPYGSFSAGFVVAGSDPVAVVAAFLLPYGSFLLILFLFYTNTI